MKTNREEHDENNRINKIVSDKMGKSMETEKPTLTPDQIKNSSFGKWAYSQDIVYLKKYLGECLRHGKKDNIVWQLFDGMQLSAIDDESLIDMAIFLKRL